MLLNSDTIISTPRRPAILVPYTPTHVPQYHAWMQDPELPRLTASEQLSLQEEHGNQKSWRADPKKLTFIILDANRGLHFMAGDVNLYLLDAAAEGIEPETSVVAEVEVMIAEAASRRKGLAGDAVKWMMAYARQWLGVDVFLAKVLEENAASLKLFDGIGFSEFRRVRAFGEVHLKLEVGEVFEGELQQVREKWCLGKYAGSKEADTPVENGATVAGKDS